ncbi:MAG: class I SAM-dependent methyltransferase [Atopobiaceae bacterium]|nr:class I SAM-dependent methyltransferase [Atopobiaceae bacterium]
MPIDETPTSQTLDYYDANAEVFASSTVDVDFSSVQQRFASLLPPGARVLDFGCGSGRDSRYFLKAGFDVTATDGSAELCKISRQLTGLPVRHELFQELSETEAYDGIWACSSILHLPKDELADVLRRMVVATKPGGVIYTSFKYGDFEGMRNGRYFTDFTEEGFRSFIEPIEGIAIEDYWVTGDVRPGRGDERWLNLLLRKA